MTISPRAILALAVDLTAIVGLRALCLGAWARRVRAT